MNPDSIKQLIEKGIADSEAHVSGDEGKFEATVVSPAFEGMSAVKRHQTVYATLQAQIASGELHALTIKAYTPKEWKSR
ncbi:MAG: BolA/IbaG family iron-sulfur metabolism protein [Gammaproteobacteria bacterium]|jgi:acid stress-induced BolA-like protein IbaG/YrbA|nr:BolA/IbaG family iron-sulfur metabolism protein [Gammaproteobacteria bacterium]